MFRCNFHTHHEGFEPESLYFDPEILYFDEFNNPTSHDEFSEPTSYNTLYVEKDTCKSKKKIHSWREKLVVCVCKPANLEDKNVWEQKTTPEDVSAA